jgi:AcrR family transcriptional regulator
VEDDVPNEQSRRRDGRTRDTRERLHREAIQLFVEQGFAQTTMQDIADRLGLTKAALYYHFPTKADLVRSVVQPAVDDVERVLDEAETDHLGSGELLERFFDVNYDHRQIFVALTRDPSGLSIADVDDWVPQLAQRFQELLAGPDASAERRMRAVMVAVSISRFATLFADLPHDELRKTSLKIATEALGEGSTTAEGNAVRA